MTRIRTLRPEAPEAGLKVEQGRELRPEPVQILEPEREQTQEPERTAEPESTAEPEPRQIPERKAELVPIADLEQIPELKVERKQERTPVQVRARLFRNRW